MRRLFGVRGLIFVAMVIGAAERVGAQDPVKVSSDVYTVRFENDQVRVLEMILKAGKKDATHSHPSEVVHFIKGSKVKIHLPEGAPLELDVPDDHVLWHEAWTHTVENAGKQDLHAIIVEIKKPAEQKPAKTKE